MRTRSKLAAAALSIGLALQVGMAGAMDDMKKDTMGKESAGAMKKDAMAGDCAGKDAMGKDAMSGDAMKKEPAGHGGTGKDPRDGLTHEWRWIGGAPLERCDDLRSGRRVAEGHRDVA